MPVPVRHGDKILQHPDDRVLYRVADAVTPSLVAIRRLLPPGDGTDLLVKATAEDVVVSGGIDGANYEIELQDGIVLKLRITSKGLERTWFTGQRDAQDRPVGAVELVQKIEKGKVIVNGDVLMVR